MSLQPCVRGVCFTCVLTVAWLDGETRCQSEDKVTRKPVKVCDCEGEVLRLGEAGNMKERLVGGIGRNNVQMVRKMVLGVGESLQSSTL